MSDSKAKMDPYSVLNIGRQASEEQIRSAYRKKMLTVHPDKTQEQYDKEKFLAVSEAYDILTDPARKRAYDVAHPLFSSIPARKEPDRSAEAGPSRPRTRYPYFWPSTPPDLDSIFSIPSQYQPGVPSTYQGSYFGPENRICIDCGERFATPELLQVHLTTSPRHLYACERCMTSFQSQAALDEHLESALNHNRCPHFLCRSTHTTVLDFPTRQGLLKHYLNSPLHGFCQKCNVDFFSKEELSHHIKTSKNHHLCCGFDFPSVDAQRQHWAEKHEEHLLCIVCRVRFGSAKEYYNHVNFSHLE